MILGKRPFFKMFYSWNLGPKLLFLHGLRASFYWAAAVLYCIARRRYLGWLAAMVGRLLGLNPLCAAGNQFPAKAGQESCFWNQWIRGNRDRKGLTTRSLGTRLELWHGGRDRGRGVLIGAAMYFPERIDGWGGSHVREVGVGTLMSRWSEEGKRASG